MSNSELATGRVDNDAVFARFQKPAKCAILATAPLSAEARRGQTPYAHGALT